LEACERFNRPIGTADSGVDAYHGSDGSGRLFAEGQALKTVAGATDAIEQ